MGLSSRMCFISQWAILAVYGYSNPYCRDVNAIYFHACIIFLKLFIKRMSPKRRLREVLLKKCVLTKSAEHKQCKVPSSFVTIIYRAIAFSRGIVWSKKSFIGGKH